MTSPSCNPPAASPKREVFFDCTNCRVLDFVDPQTRLGEYFKKTEAQFSAHHPQAEIAIMDWEAAHKLERSTYIKPVTALSAEHFNDMLYEQPPREWGQYCGIEHFVGAYLFWDIVLYCVREGASYWMFQDKGGMSANDIIDRINAGRTSVG